MSPSLSSGSKLDKRIKTQLVADCFHLVGEGGGYEMVIYDSVAAADDDDDEMMMMMMMCYQIVLNPMLCYIVMWCDDMI